MMTLAQVKEWIATHPASDLLVRNATLSIPTWNIPAALTCPGRTPWCAGHCYACHGQFVFPSVQASHDLRWLLTQDLDSFVDLMTEACKRRTIVRIHSAGDFYSLDYLRAWVDIVRNTPDTRYIVYTRTWRLGHAWLAALRELDSLPNIAVWASCDPTSGLRPDWPRIAYVNGTVGSCLPNCDKQLNGSNCRECMKCADKSQKEVCFNVH